MTRKMISLAGVVVALFAFTVGSTDAEARHGRNRGRCCQRSCNQQFCNRGCQQQSFNNGYQSQGCNSGCQANANNGYQQTSNYGPGQVTYGAPIAPVDAGLNTPAVQVAAPVPNN